MKHHPKVSIIIPVYNGSNYLRESIDSALAQTYKNLEVIVVNDGSDDNGKTEATAKLYGERIRYYSKKNGGVASALNFGIEVMRGEYLCWLSHDDIYLPSTVERQTSLLSSLTEDVIVYGDYELIDENSQTIGARRLRHVEPECFRCFITERSDVNGCSMLIRKKYFESMGRFNEQLRTTQDYDLMFRLAARYKFVHIPKVLVKHRIHGQQDTIKLRAIVIQECDQLHRGFAGKLSEHEIREYFIGPISIFYFKLSLILEGREFRQAARVAFMLAVTKLEKKNALKVALFLPSFFAHFIFVHIKRFVKTIVKIFSCYSRLLCQSERRTLFTFHHRKVK